MAAAAEGGSEHALARGVVLAAKHHLLATNTTVPKPTTSEFRAIVGKGVECRVDGSMVRVGTRQLLVVVDTNDAVIDRLEQALHNALATDGNSNGNSNVSSALTIVFVSVDDAIIGALALADVPRPESSAVVGWFAKSLGVKVTMLTGDNGAAAQSIASAVGIDASSIVANVSPAGKADFVRQLQANGAVCCFVGDGVNDAVALTQADVGVGMKSSTDVASSAANVVLMKDDLRDVVVLVDIARRAVRRIRINLCWAFVYNLLAIPIAAGAFEPLDFVLPPGLAGLSEILSSLPVIISALLLYRYIAPRLDVKIIESV